MSAWGIWTHSVPPPRAAADAVRRLGLVPAGASVRELPSLVPGITALGAFRGGRLIRRYGLVPQGGRWTIVRDDP